MKCKKCGEELEPDWEVCPNCGKPTNPNYQNPIVDIVFLVIFIGCLLFALLFNINGIKVAFVTIIIAKIVHPISQVIDVIFWITMVIAGIIVLASVFF